MKKILRDLEIDLAPLKDTAQFYFRWPRAPVPQAFKFRTQWRHPPEALGRSFNPCRFRRRFQGCSTPRAFCLRPLRPSLPRLPRRNLSTSRALRTNGRLPPGWRAATLSVTQQAASGLPSSSFSHSSSSSSSSFNPMLSRMLLLLSRFVRGLLVLSRTRTQVEEVDRGSIRGVCDDFFLFCFFSRRTQAAF